MFYFNAFARSRFWKLFTSGYRSKANDYHVIGLLPRSEKIIGFNLFKFVTRK